MAGKLIVFEGIDGSGKSTQFKMICQRLRDENTDFKQITFPRYEHQSSALIRMYLGGQFGKDPDAVNAYAASSFFAVDRYASYVQDWRDYYQNGGLILTDRYTTSNAIHQGAKMLPQQREMFNNWLYDYEFNLIALPKPDIVFYMNIDVSLAFERLASRQAKTATAADIHEKDFDYLQSCAHSGMQAAEQLSWQITECVKNGNVRTEDDIHNEIYTRLKCLITGKN